MKILVTGGAGFIGSHVVDALIARGEDVEVLDTLVLSTPHLRPDVHYHIVDVSNRSEILSSVLRMSPDVIVHLAAQSSLQLSIRYPARDAEINIVGTINLLEVAQLLNCHFILGSTSAVYSPASGMLDEKSRQKPISPYGISKWAAERYTCSYSNSTILRFGNVYGPRQVIVGENQLIPHCLGYLINNKSFVIHGDGEQVRDFVYVQDIVRGILKVIDTNTRGVYNLGTGTGSRVINVCDTLARLMGRTETWAFGPPKPGELAYVVLDSYRAYRDFGWEATTSLSDGLEATLKSWRGN